MFEEIKQLIKSKLALFNYEITRTTNKRSTLAAFLQHVSKLGFKPKTVIDVGVAYGTFELYNTFSEAKHILIEPLKEYEKVLKKISRKYKAEYVLAAAGSKKGEVIINISDDLSSSSMLKSININQKNKSREVPLIKIDDLCKEKKLEGPFLIKIDAEGAELLVLDGAQETMKNTEIIISECRLFQFFKNQPQFYDVLTYMKIRGWVVYDIFHYGTRPLDRALSIIDVAFVKEKGIFRKYHFWNNPKNKN